MNRVAEQFAILDHSPIGQLVLQGDFEVIFWNQCMEVWTKIPRDRICGTSLLDHYPHLRTAVYAGRIERIFTGGPPIVFSSQLHTYVIPAPLPGGKVRVQYTVITGMPSSEDGVYYAIFSIQDMTSVTAALESSKVALKQATAEVKERQKAESELKTYLKELQMALDEINTLKGILPICANCKKIRDHKGCWNQIEVYIRDHSEADFSHGICPTCVRELYPDFQSGHISSKSVPGPTQP